MQIETLRSIFIKPQKKGVPISGGATGFLVRSSAGTLLVSARHVFTALDNETGSPLSKDGAPDAFLVELPIKAENDGRVIFTSLEVKTCDTDDKGDLIEQKWFDHPVHGSKVDIAAVAFPHGYDQDLLTPLKNTLPFVACPPPSALFPPTTPVSVIGYPFARKGPQGTAVWTTCNVASEYGTEDDLFFYVDGATRPGQSGSPVVKFAPDGNLSPFGGIISNGRPASHFAGLYSGRINKESDIGKVWKPEVISGLCG
jgi:hypothetical protein